MTAGLVALVLSGLWAYLLLMVLLYAHFTRYRRRRRAGRRPAPSPWPPRVLLIRPCAGDEPGLLGRLVSIAEVPRDFPIRVRFGVTDPEDRALPVIRDAVRALAERGIDAEHRVAPLIGPNRKVSILADCVSDIDDIEVVISADSNVDFSGYDLNEFASALLEDEGVGAVWAPPYETAPDRGLGNTASEAILHASWHSFGLLSAIDPGGMVGKLFAVRCEALGATDHFRGLSRLLGEDMGLSRRLRKNGYRVVSHPESIRSTVGRKTWRDTVSRHVRWMMVIKAQRKRLLLSYPLLFFSALPIYALAAAGVLYSAPLGGAVFLFAVAVRLLVAASAARMLSVRPGAWLLPAAVLSDVLLLEAFSRTLFIQTFEWRGVRLSIGPDGELEDRESALS